MAKVITFSRQFPAYHPQAGQPTYFVEKFIKSIGLKYLLNDEEREFNPRLSLDEFEPKHHTIRAGHRFNAGDYFSPRVWSGKPYRSKQIVIAPDIEVKKVWDFEMTTNEYGIISISINNTVIALIGENVLGNDKLETLARNDGLEWDDMLHWFKIHPKKKQNRFDGQIISWNENINY